MEVGNLANSCPSVCLLSFLRKLHFLKLRSGPCGCALMQTLLMREARDLSGRVMKGVYQLKEQCARCLTSINQEELNRRASRLVNLAVQHYILTSVRNLRWIGYKR